MKTKKTAKEKRAEESQKRKEFWNRDREIHSAAPAPQVQAQAERISAKERALRQEAETREFLEYLQRDISVTKEEPENTMNARRKTARKTLIEPVNLEDGMPFVEEAVALSVTGGELLGFGSALCKTDEVFDQPHHRTYRGKSKKHVCFSAVSFPQRP